MRLALAFALLALAPRGVAAAPPRTVVFQQAGFPTIESLPLAEADWRSALSGHQVAVAGIDDLVKPETLAGCDLLVLPHGSAFPEEASPALSRYLEAGGNLLVVGGRALFVPVRRQEDRFVAGPAGNGWWRRFFFTAFEAVPRLQAGRFVWQDGFDFPPQAEVKARRVFALARQYAPGVGRAESRLVGLGYLVDDQGRRLAAPVTRLDVSLTPDDPSPRRRGRLVMLSFEPEPGYWSSPAGQTLLRAAADHAALGSAVVWMQLPRASVWPGESADGVLRVADPRLVPGSSEVLVEVSREGRSLARSRFDIRDETAVLAVPLGPSGEPGLHAVRATYRRAGRIVDVHETGFWRRDDGLLGKGPRFSAGRTYFERDGRPFLVVGVNHFVNDPVWSGFPENANALAWDRDFAAMEADGLNFVRTGIWSDRLRLVDPVTGTAEESVLRNLEALLQSAARHRLHVQFTFFTFDPQTLARGAGILGPGRNPYTDPVAVQAQAAFVRSVVARFREVPDLSWDLINEPSFSNPRTIFRGNVPNGDPTEVARWNEWLAKRHGTLQALAAAWGVEAASLGGFGAVPLPPAEALASSRAPIGQEVRAVDYNLFAQDAFRGWVADMVAAIRSTGSRQAIGVGHDEGGTGNRVLNAFHADAGVAFTSTHTWWNDDALLWDVLAGRRRGVPLLVGETGTQPVFTVDGRVRFTETTALGMVERKLALGLGAGSAGSAFWIWSDVDPYRLGRQDGSRSLWNDVLAGLAGFARQAQPHLAEPNAAEVAIVLPQSLQLSVHNGQALEAQQNAVRALFHHARSSADLVGEYQLDTLGSEKLLILPSPGVVSEAAWQALLARVAAGATLLVTGRFDLDEHFRETGRHRALGFDYEPALLSERSQAVSWPGGRGRASFPGQKTTFLEQARLPGGATFASRSVGRGKVLFFTLPLELSADLDLLGRVYLFALREAGVKPVYRTSSDDPGLLIAPTPFEDATLYLLTSETSSVAPVSFVDQASGRAFSVELPPGRAALLLVSKKGDLLARYDPSRIAP